jgi:hypothetical protein
MLRARNGGDTWPGLSDPPTLAARATSGVGVGRSAEREGGNESRVSRRVMAPGLVTLDPGCALEYVPLMPTLSTLLMRFSGVTACVGGLMAVVTPIIVWWTIEGLETEARDAALATGDPQRIASFEMAAQASGRSMIALTGLCLLAAVCCGAALGLLRSESKRQSDTSR